MCVCVCVCNITHRDWYAIKHNQPRIFLCNKQILRVFIVFDMIFYQADLSQRKGSVNGEPRDNETNNK